jgi:hypothetical protein
MGWRRVVHKVTGKCMSRTLIFSKAEMRLELCFDCDGETPFSAGAFMFGDLIDHAHAFEGDDVAEKILEWIKVYAP